MSNRVLLKHFVLCTFFINYLRLMKVKEQKIVVLEFLSLIFTITLKN